MLVYQQHRITLGKRRRLVLKGGTYADYAFGIGL